MLSPFAAPSLQLADDWYRQTTPILFDPESFSTFLCMNERALIESGVLMRLADRLYVVNPYFDNYMAINVSFGLMRKILASRESWQGARHE